MPFVVTKLKDEGTASPYIARLWVGIAELRNQILSSPTASHQFDKLFDPILKTLDKARESARGLLQNLDNHRRALEQPGTAEVYPNGQLMVHDAIAEPLAKNFDSFTQLAHRAIKLTQRLMRDIGGIEIGFLFQKPNAFNDGCDKLAASHPALAGYLRSARNALTEPLALLRNNMEHDGWTLGSPRYQVSDGRAAMIEPMINGISLSSFTRNVANLAVRAIEDLVVYALRMRLLKPVAIIELPEIQRASIQPKRFALGLEADERAWRLTWARDGTDFLWNGQ